MQTLDVGENATIDTSWFNSDDEAAEPSAITLTVIAPDGTESAFTKAGMTGSSSVEGSGVLDVWSAVMSIDQEGIWRFTPVGTVDGATVTQNEQLFLAGPASATPGPCQQWCSWDDVEGLCPTVETLGTLTVPVREQILDLATSILYQLDGGHYPGICEASRRVCRGCVTCGAGLCCCGVRSSIDLGTRWPIWAVWDVVIDGETLPVDAYTVRDRRYLERVDGSWPATASLSDPDGFSFSLAFGRKPPAGLAHASAVFASEMAKKCLGVKCELPARVVSLTRDGTSYVILDSQKFLDEKRTGVYAVDLALRAAAEARKLRPGMRSPVRGQRTVRR